MPPCSCPFGSQALFDGFPFLFQLLGVAAALLVGRVAGFRGFDCFEENVS